MNEKLKKELLKRGIGSEDLKTFDVSIHERLEREINEQKQDLKNVENLFSTTLFVNEISEQFSFEELKKLLCDV